MADEAGAARWRHAVRAVSAVLLVLLIVLFFVGQFRPAFGDPCAGLPVDIACVRFVALPFAVIVALSLALALASINLVSHRPGLLVCGWLACMAGLAGWMIAFVMNDYLFGRDTTLARAIAFTAVNWVTIFPAINLAIALLLLLPVRNAIRPHLERSRAR